MFMLTERLWTSIIPGNQWMNFVGRLVFPIFALISEIPYDLFKNGMSFFPFDQNVMFTLLIGLVALELLEKYKDHDQKYIISFLIVFIITLIGTILFVDYGGKGVLMILSFYFFKDSKSAQFAAIVILNVFLFQGYYIPIDIFNTTIDFQTQGFAVLTLPLIWLYNDKKSDPSRFNRQIAYWFYPVHMYILYFLMSR